MKEDIRWKQRFDNYKKALKRLRDNINYYNTKKLSDIEEQGLIKSFEFTYELSWKTMKDYLGDMGIFGIIGSKGAFREAFRNELIPNGQVWIDMIDDRNLSSHTYDDTIKNKLIKNIVDTYYNEFVNFEKKMIEISGE
ncbi:MAG: nucleotidyltransferase substrate binding protein [Endomicrobium sp.]|nr:nucleotidyltransferase substrate binding protein [Endomicrobium sp.]